MRVFAAQINPTIGDVEGNLSKVLDALSRARTAKADVVLFPELTLSGYPPEDLLLDPSFIDAIQATLDRIAPATQGMFVAVGLPRPNPTGTEKPLYNSAAIFADGALLGFKNKTLLPTYDVFDERRYFEPGAREPVWEYLGRRIGVTICEDVWQHAHAVGYTKYVVDPVAILHEERIDLLLNLSASPYYYEKKALRLSVFGIAAKALRCPVVVCNQVGANDQLIFDGNSMYLNEKGELIQKGAGFAEDDLVVDLESHACAYAVADNGLSELYQALVLGVRDYFHKQGFSKALIGLSGGIDSALACCIGVDALGAENVVALNMPSRYSSKKGIEDAKELASRLKIELKTVEIDGMYETYLRLLEPCFEQTGEGLMEENLQSRIRGMILMAFSNKTGALVLTTGNKTEMAFGYTTLYGDMCGALGVLQDVTKSRVYELAGRQEAIPRSILEKEPSAELRHDQRTTDALGAFDVIDPVLQDYIEKRLPLEEIARERHLNLDYVQQLVRQIHLNEYKRRQAPIGLRVTERAFTKGRIVPIMQCFFKF
jgi:NAD+ synthase (glutamine-hydrolysing)